MFEAGIIIVILSIIASRFIAEKAYKVISDDEKTKIVDGFSNFRRFNILPILIIFVLYILAERFLSQHVSREILLIVFCALVVLYMLGSQYLVFKKLNQLKIRPEFVRYAIISRVVSHAGLTIMIVFLVLDA